MCSFADGPAGRLSRFLLNSSYWQRCLQRGGDDLKQLHEAVIRGRAAWLWSHSNAAKRKGYFAAGVGYVAGKSIEAKVDTIGSLLKVAETALAEGEVFCDSSL